MWLSVLVPVVDVFYLLAVKTRDEPKDFGGVPARTGDDHGVDASVEVKISEAHCRPHQQQERTAEQNTYTCERASMYSRDPLCVHERARARQGSYIYIY